MTVRATLWKYKPRRDGSCNIKLYIQDKGKKRYQKTDYHAHPKEWDDRRGRLKRNSPLATRINAILSRLEAEVKNEIVGVDISLITFIEKYIDDCQSGREDLAVNTWKRYCAHLNHLNTYMKIRELTSINFSDIDLNFYADFTGYLRKNGCGASGVANHVKIIKKFMQMGLDRKLHSNTTFKAKAFHAERVVPRDKIYLSQTEIMAIAGLDLHSLPGLEKERDRFLVSYYMVMRFGDSIRITEANITQQGPHTYYKNIAEKTGVVSFIPVKPAALELLKRNNYDLSGDTNQEANRKLKTIAAMAGILMNMAEPGGGQIPKSSMVTTHTARRSAATNLLLSGVPLSEIMQLGGWKNEATLRQYLLAGGIKLAQLSAGRAFFQ
jgi:site-specific recombinase XerD